MKTDISKEHSKEILTEMCRRVGVDVETFNFNQKNWFWQHEWTETEEEDFRKWLGTYLVAKKYAPKGTKRGQNAGYYEAGKLLGNYGWKIKK